LSRWASEQVLGGDAKAARGDLLDRRGRVVAVPARDMARWVLAALAAVGLGADTVHGDRECLVGLGSEGAQRDAGRYQPLADLGDRFDLVGRDARALRVELEEVPQIYRRRIAQALALAP